MKIGRRLTRSLNYPLTWNVWLLHIYARRISDKIWTIFLETFVYLCSVR